MLTDFRANQDSHPVRNHTKISYALWWFYLFQFGTKDQELTWWIIKNMLCAMTKHRS